MILARLADSARLRAIHPAFPAALDWLAGPAATAAEGRHDIDGDRCYALVQAGTTRDAAEGRFESHAAYLDIQCNLAGGESIGWAPAAELAVETGFKPGGDIRFHAEPVRAATALALQPGDLAVFWPEDAHKPCCHLAGEAAPFRKVVVKILV